LSGAFRGCLPVLVAVPVFSHFTHCTLCSDINIQKFASLTCYSAYKPSYFDHERKNTSQAKKESNVVINKKMMYFTFLSYFSCVFETRRFVHGKNLGRGTTLHPLSFDQATEPTPAPFPKIIVFKRWCTDAVVLVSTTPKVDRRLSMRTSLGKLR
jgi:hypothetical protein